MHYSSSSYIPEMSPASEDAGETVQPHTPPSKRDLKFWLVFSSMCISLSLSALELSSLSTALPTIASNMHTSQFSWVGSAFALSGAAFLPMSGGLAQTFGRRPTLLVTIALFALGSGICGGAKSIGVLIAGRSIQGLGSGGIQSLTEIVLADLVTLEERGLYVSLYGLVWGVAGSVGPVIGGTFTSHGQWRWLFYLNLPIPFVACLSIIFFLDLPVPPGNWREKLLEMDWIGNFLIVSSTVAYTIGLTWGGITAPWGSATVLVPLVLGLVGLGVFIAYEATLAAHPLVPFSLMTNLTSISGHVKYIQTFCTTVTTLAVIYYFPVYFQACKGASPIESGIYSLAVAVLAPVVVAIGISIKVTQRYRLQSWIGWTITVITFGLMTLILATDSLGKSIGYLAFLGCGIGVLGVTPLFPIQAPLPVMQNAPALAFTWFLRAFASVWGITIGSTVLQNELAKRLPRSFVESVPQGTAIAYALIPRLSEFPPETRFEVQVAFAGSLAVLWNVLATVGGAGLVASFFIKELPLNNALDENWALKFEKEDKSV